MHLKQLLLLLSVQLSVLTTAQTNNFDSTLFSISELQEDFNYWKRLLTDKHPILYHYNTPKAFNHYFDSIYRKIDRPMTKADFFRIIGPTSSFTKCAHNQVYSGSAINDDIMDHESLIPVNIEWFDGSAYVTYNYTNNPSLDPGTLVSEINGFRIEDIYSKSLSLLPDDGYSNAYAQFWVNKQFYFYYHLLFGFSENYTLQTPHGNTVVEGMSVDEMERIQQIKPTLVPESFEGIKHYSIDSLNTMVLRVGSFFDSDFKKLHKAGFKKVVDTNIESVLSVNPKYLIIDLRGNDGGQPKNPLYLLKYLMREPFVFKEEVRTLKDKNETNSFIRSEKVFFPDGRVGTFKPAKSKFEGKIYIIVDGGTTSAAGEFASVIRRYRRGKIIGTETGGNPIILTGYGLGSQKKLPNTKLPVSVGNKTTFMNDVKLDNGYGLIPDEVIRPTISDYLNKNDPCTSFILNEIEKLQR